MILIIYSLCVAGILGSSASGDIPFSDFQSVSITDHPPTSRSDAPSLTTVAPEEFLAVSITDDPPTSRSDAPSVTTVAPEEFLDPDRDLVWVERQRNLFVIFLDALASPALGIDTSQVLRGFENFMDRAEATLSPRQLFMLGVALEDIRLDRGENIRKTWFDASNLNIALTYERLFTVLQLRIWDSVSSDLELFDSPDLLMDADRQPVVQRALQLWTWTTKSVIPSYTDVRDHRLFLHSKSVASITEQIRLLEAIETKANELSQEVGFDISNCFIPAYLGQLLRSFREADIWGLLTVPSLNATAVRLCRWLNDRRVVVSGARGHILSLYILGQIEYIVENGPHPNSRQIESFLRVMGEFFRTGEDEATLHQAVHLMMSSSASFERFVNQFPLPSSDPDNIDDGLERVIGQWSRNVKYDDVIDAIRIPMEIFWSRISKKEKIRFQNMNQAIFYDGRHVWGSLEYLMIISYETYSKFGILLTSYVPGLEDMGPVVKNWASSSVYTRDVRERMIKDFFSDPDLDLFSYLSRSTELNKQLGKLHGVQFKMIRMSEEFITDAPLWLPSRYSRDIVSIMRHVDSLVDHVAQFLCPVPPVIVDYMKRIAANVEPTMPYLVFDGKDEETSGIMMSRFIKIGMDIPHAFLSYIVRTYRQPGSVSSHLLLPEFKRIMDAWLDIVAAVGERNHADTEEHHYVHSNQEYLRQSGIVLVGGILEKPIRAEHIVPSLNRIANQVERVRHAIRENLPLYMIPDVHELLDWLEYDVPSFGDGGF